MKKKREEAILKVQKRTKEDKKAKDEMKREREKFALKEIMKVGCIFILFFLAWFFWY